MIEEHGGSMWDTIVGGVLAIGGGWIAAWYAAKNIRKSRMEEIVAERKVTANAEAYSHIKELEGMFVQATATQTYTSMIERESWFFSNRLFLPGKFPAYWLAIRHDLGTYCRWESSPSKTPEQMLSLSKRIRDALAQSIDEIFEDMNLSKIDIEQSDEK